MKLTDSIVSKHTAFGTAAELVAAMATGYVPTVSKRRQGGLLLALNALGYAAFVTA